MEYLRQTFLNFEDFGNNKSIEFIGFHSLLFNILEMSGNVCFRKDFL